MRGDSKEECGLEAYGNGHPHGEQEQQDARKLSGPLLLTRRPVESLFVPATLLRALSNDSGVYAILWQTPRFQVDLVEADFHASPVKTVEVN